MEPDSGLEVVEVKLDPPNMGMSVHEHVGALTLGRGVLAVRSGRSGLSKAFRALGLLALRWLGGEFVLVVSLVFGICHLEHPPKQTAKSEHNMLEQPAEAK
jgi:predicted DNA repair protein MutK